MKLWWRKSSETYLDFSTAAKVVSNREDNEGLEAYVVPKVELP